MELDRPGVARLPVNKNSQKTSLVKPRFLGLRIFNEYYREIYINRYHTSPRLVICFMRTIGNNARVKLEEKDSGSFTNHIGTKFQLPTPRPWHKDIDSLAVPKAQSFERFDRFEWICFIASPVSATIPSHYFQRKHFHASSLEIPNNIFSKYQT